MKLIDLIDNSAKKMLLIGSITCFYFFIPWVVSYFDISFYDHQILGADIFYNQCRGFICSILNDPDKHYFILSYLSLCYISLVIFSYVNLIFAWNDQSYMLSNFLLGCILTLGYVLTPTQGPYFSEHIHVIDPQQFPLISQLNFKLVEFLSNKGDAFPSAHCAYAIFLATWCWKRNHFLKYLALPFGLSVITSTIILGQHYIIDVIAGCIIGFGIITYTDYYVNKLSIPERLADDANSLYIGNEKILASKAKS